jgi:AcrR family transcriptional regulator
MSRRYRLQRRAERQAETRRRIVEAAVELHTTVGPAHTTDLAIAERAGVTRRTFYRHFPDEVTLFRACSTHGLERWPPPELESWRRIADPEQRLSVALRELYSYYAVAGAGLVVLLRDAARLRPELNVSPSRAEVLMAMPGALLKGWRLRGRRRAVLVAAIHHATAVTTWHSLVVQQGLTEAEAVGLLVAMVFAATRPQPSGLSAGPVAATRMPSVSGRVAARAGPGLRPDETPTPVPP